MASDIGGTSDGGVGDGGTAGDKFIGDPSDGSDHRVLQADSPRAAAELEAGE